MYLKNIPLIEFIFILTGALVGMLYMLLGYGFYSLIDGSEPAARVLAMEIAAGALVGAVAGVVLANLRGRRHA